METYILSYDLKDAGGSEQYRKIGDYIKSTYSLWAKPLESVWLIKTAKTAPEIREGLKPFLNSQDKILVVKITGKAWAGFRLTDTVASWMHKNV